MKYLVLIITFLVLTNSFSQVSDTLIKVYFEFDSYELTKQAKVQIDTKIKLYNKTSKIKLIGYSDKVGPKAYNLKLSEKRCNSVKLYLISNGVLEINIVSVIGKGEKEEYSQLSKNREVLIVSTRSILLPPPSLIIKKEVANEEITNDEHLEKESLEAEVNDLKIGETLAIKGLNFIPGRHFLLPNSEPKLYELLKILKENSELKIEIHGHICCSPDGQDGYDVDTDSKQLSLNRAFNIYEYLVFNGIHENRLSYKGFGPTKPLVKEIDESTRQMNRRVEIKIVGE